jgi:membrane associated rhomboid family serine protease
MKTSTIRIASRTVVQTVFGCVAAFIIFVIQYMIFGEYARKFLLMQPMLNGFLHVDFWHLTFNVFILFLLLLPDINDHYRFKNIFFITLIISLSYLPFTLFGIAEPAVGLSGTVYFLMTRWLLSWSYFKTGLSLLAIICLGELNPINEKDQVAHGVHLLGVAIAILTLRRKKIKQLKHSSFNKLLDL